jgi:hypothetical protein
MVKLVSEQLLKGKSYFDHETLCKVGQRRWITLRVNANGLLVCREWKKCGKQGEEGCAESYYRTRLKELLSGKTKGK